MKYYAVIDTNVIVSSFLKKGSIPNQVVNQAAEGDITPLISDEILLEYQQVLEINKFGLSQDEVDNLLAKFNERGIRLDRTITDEEFIDSDDIIFYEIALTGKKEKETYLITGNKKHFPVKSFVVTPREMMDIIESDKKSNWESLALFFYWSKTTYSVKCKNYETICKVMYFYV